MHSEEVRKQGAFDVFQRQFSTLQSVLSTVETERYAYRYRFEAEVRLGKGLVASNFGVPSLSVDHSSWMASVRELFGHDFYCNHGGYL